MNINYVIAVPKGLMLEFIMDLPPNKGFSSDLKDAQVFNTQDECIRTINRLKDTPGDRYLILPIYIK